MRPSQTERKEYRPCSSNRPSTSRVQDDSSESEDMLERWDEMMHGRSDDDLD